MNPESDGGSGESPVAEGAAQQPQTVSDKVICVVPGCNIVLHPRPNDRSQRQKVCSDHQAADTVQLQPGVDCRFCQRCARFQPVEWFEGSKRSCEASLAAHNLRRRRSRAEQKLNDDLSSIPSGYPEMKCIVDGCGEILDPRQYMQRRYKACVAHQRALRVLVEGVQQRFCQQCSRFQPVEDFDDDKHSCRARLESHNARRRKQPRLLNDGENPDVSPPPSSRRRRSSLSVQDADRASSPVTSSAPEGNTRPFSPTSPLPSRRGGSIRPMRFSTLSEESGTHSLGSGIGGQLARLSAEVLPSSGLPFSSLTWDDCASAPAGATRPASMERPFPMFPADAYYRSHVPTQPAGSLLPSALPSSPRLAGHRVPQTANFLRQQEAQAIAQAALEYNYLLSGTSTGASQIPAMSWVAGVTGQAVGTDRAAGWEMFTHSGLHHQAAEPRPVGRFDSTDHRAPAVSPAAARTSPSRHTSQKRRKGSLDSPRPAASRRKDGTNSAGHGDERKR